MFLGEYSDFISFCLIILFIPCLNSFTNSFPLYLLSFATLLNSYTNSSVVLFSYSTIFSFAIFIISLLSPPNSSSKSDKNSLIVA